MTWDCGCMVFFKVWNTVWKQYHHLLVQFPPHFSRVTILSVWIRFESFVVLQKPAHPVSKIVVGQRKNLHPYSTIVPISGLQKLQLDERSKSTFSSPSSAFLLLFFLSDLHQSVVFLNKSVGAGKACEHVWHYIWTEPLYLIGARNSLTPAGDELELLGEQLLAPLDGAVLAVVGICWPLSQEELAIQQLPSRVTRIKRVIMGLNREEQR